MKKALIAVLLAFAVIATPVMSLAFECCHDEPGQEHSAHDHNKDDGKTTKSHPNHNCCHTNSANVAESNVEALAFDFTSGKFAMKQVQLRSLHEPSPLLEPPSQA